MEKVDKVIVGLECCADLDRSCEGCSYDGVGYCEVALMRDARDVINGLRLRCNRLEAENADRRKRVEELSELLNEWEPVVHGKVEALKVPRPMRVEIVTNDFTNLEFARNNELWRKRYYCPSCGEKLIDDTYEKDRVYMSWCAARIREKMCCCPYCGTKVEQEVSE